MDMQAAGTARSDWPAQEKQESASASEANRLTQEMKTEKDELSQLTKEFTEHISKGERDKAQLKSAEIQQKQMAIQAKQLQLDKLTRSAQSAAGSVKEAAAPTADASVDQADAGWAALDPDAVRPAAILELSRYAENLLNAEA